MNLLNWRKTQPVAGTATVAGTLPSNVPVSVADPLPVSLTPPATASTTAATFADASKTVAAAGTPEVLAAASTLVDTVIIAPLRTNTGAVYIGVAAGNDTQTIPLPVALTAPDGKKIDLNLIYVDVAVNGEGVRYSTIN